MIFSIVFIGLIVNFILEDLLVVLVVNDKGVELFNKIKLNVGE